MTPARLRHHEECAAFRECATYTAVHGEHVIAIEYFDDSRRTFEDMCRDAETPRSVVLRDRALSAPTSPDYVFEHCAG